MNAPPGLVTAIHQVRTAGKTMAVYFEPKTGYVRALPVNRRKPSGSVRVGTYSALVLGQELAQTVRADVERVALANVPRGTENTRKLINDLQQTWAQTPRRWLG